MKIMKLFCTVLSVLFVFALVGCDAKGPKEEADRTASVTGKPSTNIIAYSMGNNIEHVKQYPLDKLTHIIYSFLHLTGNELTFDNPQSEKMARSLVALKQQHPHLKIMVALGGWGGCETCSEVFSSNEGVSEFVQSAHKLITEYELDGLDLDWEYPVVEGYPGHARSPDDKDNFTRLVKELRLAFGPEKLITFAAGGYNEFLNQAIDWSSVMPHLDWVNLMSYDLVNGYSTITGHHTPLYSYEKGPAEEQIESTNNAVDFLLKNKVPANKIVIGAAYYARVWENVSPGNNGLFQTNAKFLSSVDFKKLESYFNDNQFATFWDDTAKAPYAYSSEQQLFATYDDEQSVEAKANYVKSHDLNGIMFWQLSGDKSTSGLTDVIYRTLAKD